MATVDECRQALRDLSERMAANAAAVADRIDLDRPIAVTLRDLGESFHGRLVDGRIENLTDGDDPKAKIRLTATSDDLIAMVTGQLDFARAWGSGRVSVRANPFDLLKLRKLM
jgi:hypothetical protein